MPLTTAGWQVFLSTFAFATLMDRALPCPHFVTPDSAGFTEFCIPDKRQSLS
jgi:hypothetical protein